MKVIILAGGKGSRLSEYTKNIPKPMVKILKIPIIVRIIKHYEKFGFKDYIIASGYKSKIIENYFKKNLLNLKIDVVNTGNDSMTGGRILRLAKLIGNHRFMLTYGDALSNVNLKKLLNFHKKSQNYVTLTAVRPPARFGGIKLSGKKVKYFKEKSRLDEGWINGGFFVVEPEFLNFIGTKNVMLERSPLAKAVKTKNLAAYKHNSFWFCMDTLRDKEVLELLIKNQRAPWLK